MHSLPGWSSWTTRVSSLNTTQDFAPRGRAGCVPLQLTSRSRKWLVTLFMTYAIALPVAAPSAAIEARLDEEAVDAEVSRGFDLMKRRRVDDALRAFKKADKLAGGESAGALIGLAEAYNHLGAWRNAEKAAERAILAAAGNKYMEAAAYNALGLAHLAGAVKDPDHLDPAERAFRAALERAGDTDPVLNLNLAEALMRQGRDAEGIPLIETYLATDPAGPSAARARSLLDNPRRSRENLVPDFGMATLDGRYVTPGDFSGRAVLLDFWGTWCGPCRTATPSLARLHKKLSGDPFVLVGVSNDATREVVEKYVAENSMDWTQVWDQDGRVGRDAFLVRSYPTYVVLDHEGRVVYRVSGWGDGIRIQLEREVFNAVRKARKATRDGAESKGHD